MNIESERAAFEAWAARQYPNAIRRDALGAFSRDLRKASLEGWQARAALTAGAQDGVMFGFDDKSVMVSQEVYQIFMDRERAYREAIAPNHSEQVRELPPFAQKVIRKLKRFEECAEDSGSGGVDIGRHWLDLLTQLGLLNRVQRSPGMWEISQQGEDLLAAAPSAGSQKDQD